MADEGRGGGTRGGPFPIVGLGASAGGLEALEEFFSRMPKDAGVGFVVVTHLHAGQPSMLAELLGRKTAMPVVEVGGDTAVCPDHVYTVKPGFNLSILGGVLHPLAAGDEVPRRMPIDSFFRSLAQDQKERAIGIVLSGTGTDGSLGIKEIKGELGMVMVQDEKSARYAGMPQSAITTRLVDYVLPPAAMPEQLVAYVRGLEPSVGRTAVARELPPPDAMHQVFALIRDATGHDFSQYKMSTVHRRIERRMNVHHLGTVENYVEYLRSNPVEIDLLFKELLIGVTSFFRDAGAWSALASAISALLAQKPDDYVLRAWVPACSTGEEAYSLAMMLRETMDALGRTLGVQVFATDLDAGAIEVARLGVYPSGITNDVSTQRLARFFSHEDDVYRVQKEIREMIVFAPQNLIRDPPFTRLDILSCRNVLIYLGAELQKRLVPLFHYALKPDGILFLGPSESLGSFAELFDAVDAKWRIFRWRQAQVGAALAGFPPLSQDAPKDHAIRSSGTHLERAAEKALLKDLVPPLVLVRDRGDVVYVHGRTGKFLEPQQGSPAAANIFNMAREGLQIALTAAIRQAADTGKEVVRRGIQVKTNGDRATIDLRVARLHEPEPLRGLLRITFEQAQPPGGVVAADDVPDAPDRVGELQKELSYTRQSHQGTIEELETANEELKSTNEELQSTNEELQSTNEELETAKEEMHSLNEELQSVNSELHGKVEELSLANNDMMNLLNGTSIAMVFLDEGLRIKKYTEPAKKVLPLIPTDVGRPIADLAPSLHYDRLVEEAREVLQTLAFKEMEVSAGDGAAYLMRILPYRTTENVIEGLVLTFVDITRCKLLQQEQRRLLQALANSPTSVCGLDSELRYTWACSKVFGRPPAELIGKTDAELFRGADAEVLTALKRNVLATGVPSRQRLALEVGGKRRNYDLYVEPKRDPTGRTSGLSCVAVDITFPP
ncbi:MAG TPA: chemotaxis protein CheB [Planctomycetota bacterium]